MEKLSKACEGKSASRGGLNLSEFKSALKTKFPELVTRINQIKTRKQLESLCLEYLTNNNATNNTAAIDSEVNIEREIKRNGDYIKLVKTKKGDFYELPKEYCEDYTLVELAEKAGKNIKLTSKDRYKICAELNLPKYNPVREMSLGYPRDIIIQIADKIQSGKELNMKEERIFEQWNRNHGPIRDRLDQLSKKFTSGEKLSKSELEFFDEELFNKYCRCILKRKKRDKDLLVTKDLEKIMDKIPNYMQDKANKIVSDNLGNQSWNNLDNDMKDQILAKLLPIFLGLTYGGCKSSVYQKTRKIKPRNRTCDYELSQAEIYIQEKN